MFFLSFLLRELKQVCARTKQERNTPPNNKRRMKCRCWKKQSWKKRFYVFCEGERKTSLKKHIWEKQIMEKLILGKDILGNRFCKNIFWKNTTDFEKTDFGKTDFEKPNFGKKLLEKLILEKPILQKLILENPILKIYLYMYLSIGRELLMPLGGTKLGQSLLSCLMHLVP